MKNLFARNTTTETTDLVTKYRTQYAGQIRTPNAEWEKNRIQRYNEHPELIAIEANNAKSIFNSYSSENKPMESKRTFVLWKLNSYCSTFAKCGNKNCLSNNCINCPVFKAANQQLKEIDEGTDTPTNLHALNRIYGVCKKWDTEDGKVFLVPFKFFSNDNAAIRSVGHDYVIINSEDIRDAAMLMSGKALNYTNLNDKQLNAINDGCTVIVAYTLFNKAI